MSLWIKICGNTSLADAQLAVEAGADAVGFVFAASSRQVNVAQVAPIVAHLPSNIEKIGVFVDANLNEISSAVRVCSLTGVQLHFNAASDLPRRLHEQFGPALRILRVMHFEKDHSESFAQEILAHTQNPHVDAIMIDSRTTTAAGGTGVQFDWAEARKAVFANAGAWKLVVAGGLNPSNVAQAIATLEPWGVDVVSGVEAAPGRKDPLKVAQFVTNARAAAREF